MATRKVRNENGTDRILHFSHESTYEYFNTAPLQKRFLFSRCNSGYFAVGKPRKERLMWLATHCSVNFSQLSSGLKAGAGKAVNLVSNRAYTERAKPNRYLKHFFSSAFRTGLTHVSIYEKAALKKGQWVLVEVPAKKISGKKINFTKKSRWKESYDCKTTNIVDGIDPVTGMFHYKRKCKTRSKSLKVTLKAKLSKRVEMTFASFKPAWVVGTIVKNGPNWVIGKARVIELPKNGSLDFLRPGADQSTK
ncbi:MAG: hypothetical protein GY822_32075 [Deltaproteobacteria bacterium]|nr:hypothetical protein [Deltaproteobacteria bacterium]